MLRTFFSVGCTTILCLAAGIAAAQPPAPVPDTSADDVEILARGPVHEGFAEPVVFDAQPGLLVTKQPPEPIDEVPTDSKPAGDHVVWMPGYWAWEAEGEDFIWISGFWRSLPPGREWLPGYWNKEPDGWRWISGYWAKSDEEDVEFLPAPPASVEAGPSTPAPTLAHVWMPGVWTWNASRFVWKPGYWYRSQPDWVWVPAHYVWTPRGYLFVAGYWDYTPVARGLLCAPVRFRPAWYARPAVRYCPRAYVNVNYLTQHFFVRPGYCHYYFGDYYSVNFVSVGIVPWYAFQQQRHCYDPLFVHHHCTAGGGRTAEVVVAELKRDFEHRRDHEEERPVRRVALADLSDPVRGPKSRDHLIGNIETIKQSEKLPWQVEQLTDRRREELIHTIKNTRDFTQQRVKLETSPGLAALVQPLNKPGNETRPGSPVTLPGEVKNPVRGRPDSLNPPPVAGQTNGTKPDLIRPTVRPGTPGNVAGTTPPGAEPTKIKRPKSPLVFNNPTANPQTDVANPGVKNDRGNPTLTDLRDRIRQPGNTGGNGFLGGNGSGPAIGNAGNNRPGTTLTLPGGNANSGNANAGNTNAGNGPRPGLSIPGVGPGVLNRPKVEFPTTKAPVRNENQPRVPMVNPGNIRPNNPSPPRNTPSFNTPQVRPSVPQVRPTTPKVRSSESSSPAKTTTSPSRTEQRRKLAPMKEDS
jgi:hypothetical protein